MLSALIQQQNSASYNPTPQAFYGPVGGGSPLNPQQTTQGQTPHFNRPDQAFPGQHVNPNATQAGRNGGNGVSSPSGGGNVMQQQHGSGSSAATAANFTSGPYTHLQQAPTPNKYPMAAPPLPHTPTSQPQSATSNNALASPTTPQSPGSQNREQQRINVLFEINVTLLQEVNRLQAEGHGGAISQQQAMQLRNEGKPDKMASDEYVQCLRRVQANLSYLAPKASADASGVVAKPGPPGPAHMTPPPHMPQLASKYEQLKELFPGWSGLDHRPSQSSSSPGPSGSNGMGTRGAPAQAQA